MNRLFIVAAILGSLFLSQPLPAQEKGWEVVAADIKSDNYYPVTIANGMIGMVSTADPFQLRRIMMGGVYDVHGNDRVSHILEMPNPLGLRFTIDGETICRNDQVTHFKQVLDMKKANLTTSFNYQDKANITYTLYALRQLPYVCMMDVTVSADSDINLDVKTEIPMPAALSRTGCYKYELNPSHAPGIRLLSSTAKSPTGSMVVAASNSFMFEKAVTPAVTYMNGDQSMQFETSVGGGGTFKFTLLGSVITSAQIPNPLNQSQRMLAFAQLEGKGRLLARHIQEWDALWESDIELKGDDAMQLEIRKMIYHLYSFARKGNANSIPPMGLSNSWYSGHIFWDAELWMFPALLLLQPDMARSMLEYRIERLDAARQNALMNGYRGAMFPWESADSGFEETPLYALTGPFEHHITADVGIAAWNYYCVTRDLKWLAEKGYPLLKETADFWLSRVEKSGEYYNINNVVAADEWAENVDNNAFTNAAARANLLYAGEAARLLKKKANPAWSKVAAGIRIESFPNGVIKEHASYQGEKIKQADVNLLSYPLKEITDKHRAKINLEYYKSRVGDGPAMTHSIFSIIYSRLDDPENALSSFLDGLQPNLLPPFGVIAETAGGTNPYFATGAGGFLQAILYGFGGLDISSQGIVQLKTRLPAHWKSLTLKGIGKDKKDFYIVNNF